MKDGGPAFPTDYSSVDGFKHKVEAGMSLRDWFAAKAMQGMITALTEFKKNMLDGDSIIKNRPKDISELSYLYADAMLKEREK